MPPFLPKKTPSPSKFRKKRPIPKNQLVKNLVDGFKKRYYRITEVIDEAFHLGKLKEKIWAVELLLKWTQPDLTWPSSENKTTDKLPQDLVSSLSNKELIQKIKELLHDSPPPEKPNKT